MSSPALNEKTFDRVDNIFSAEGDIGQRSVMTLRGTTEKAAMLTILVALAAVGVFAFRLPPFVFIISLLTACISGIAIYFAPQWVKVLAPIYCLSEGASIGFLIALCSTYRQVAMQAALCTLAVAFIMFAGYRIGIFSASNRARTLMSGAVSGVAIFYLINIILSLCGWHFFTGAGVVGLIINIVICGIASYCFVIDFDNIKLGVEHGAPKIMEWYCAYSLTVTIIWVYLEMLRLLASRRD